jgi:hypothetical protein
MKYLVLFVNTLGRLRCVRRGRQGAGAADGGREAVAARPEAGVCASCLRACASVRLCVTGGACGEGAASATMRSGRCSRCEEYPGPI